MKDITTKEVRFLTSFEHRAHIDLFNEIGVTTENFRHRYNGRLSGTPIGDVISGIYWDDADLYIIEGSAPLYSASARKIFDRDAQVIYLGGDRGMYALSRGSEPTDRDSIIGTLLERFGGPAVRKAICNTIDGAIVVSDFIADYTRAIVGPDTPIHVAHPFIEKEVYRALGRVEPSLEDNVAVTVGRAMGYKGIDQLVEIWPNVRQRHSGAELHIVGPGGHPLRYENTPGVTVKGYVENLSDAFEPASLYVQPSRGDAFVISVVEAMRAGVPALTTLSTGARSEARAVDDKLVVDTAPDALLEGIVRYFDRSLNERRELSARARERGSKFDPASRKAAFRQEFKSLIDRLD